MSQFLSVCTTFVLLFFFNQAAKVEEMVFSFLISPPSFSLLRARARDKRVFTEAWRSRK